MADGSLIEPLAVWEGKMEIAGVEVHGAFEVFDSGGNWEILFGKPLLKAFKAIHDYTSDIVTIGNEELSATLQNEINISTVKNKCENQGTLDKQDQNSHDNGKTSPKEDLVETHDTGQQEEQQDTPAAEINLDALKDDDNLFTRFTNPFKKERVEDRSK